MRPVIRLERMVAATAFAAASAFAGAPLAQCDRTKPIRCDNEERSYR